MRVSSIFFFTDTATTEIYTLSHTTLFRSLQRLHQRLARRGNFKHIRHGASSSAWFWHLTDDRSEEHTSELQSRVDLVCRLLLEKKKTRPPNMTADPWRWLYDIPPTDSCGS